MKTIILLLFAFYPVWMVGQPPNDSSASRMLQIAGYTQIRYQAFSEEAKNDGFDVRRARLDFRGNFTPVFSYRLQVDMANSPKIVDAYGEIKINDYLNITFGQFRIPFSLENLTSMNKFDLIDFSQAVDALSSRGKDVIGNHNGRDIGIQLGGILLKKGTAPVIEYRLGIFNGSGTNIADTANEAKDIAVRLIVNPVKSLSLGLSWYDGWGKAIKPSADFIGRSQERNRLGLEASYINSRVALKGEYIMGTDGNTNRAGWYAVAGYYLIPDRLQLVVKYDTFDPNTDADDNVTNNYVGGINFIFNTWSKIQLFYTVREEQGVSIDNNFLSFQYQIGF